MKRFHGLARANGYGLVSVSKQTKLTVIEVNLKKIAKLFSQNIYQNNNKNRKNKILILFFRFFINIIKNKVTFSVIPESIRLATFLSRKTNFYVFTHHISY